MVGKSAKGILGQRVRVEIEDGTETGVGVVTQILLVTDEADDSVNFVLFFVKLDHPIKDYKGETVEQLRGLESEVTLI